MRSLLCAISMLLVFEATPGLSAETLQLESGWRLQSSAKISGAGDLWSTVGADVASWYPTSVPRTVLAALVDRGVYPDPYYGLNLKQVPGYQDGLWLVMSKDSPFRDSWWYRTEFEVPASYRGQFVTLHLDGVNFQANVWINGKRIADSDAIRGMFRRFELPVSEFLNIGAANALAIEIIPPGLIEDKEYKTKQVEATTGWDDHNPQPPDLNMGLWQGVSLRAQGPLSLRHPYVETHLNTDTLNAADLTVSAYLRNNTRETVKGVVRAEIGGAAPLSQGVELGPNETRELFFRPEDCPELHVENPRVWWPNPLGTQELYTLNVQASVGETVSDTASTRFGIRDAATFINPEDWRTYRINGRNILIRGGAWMTTDMLLRLDHSRYEALIRYAREANLNMLRSEGFSVRETDDFYDLCDQYGVMVTQQIFGRSIPDEELAIACIDDMMLRIRNHPSLVHFLGHDETFPTDTLNAAYQEIIAKYRVQRGYQPHSGAFDVSERGETGGTRTGTRELWTYATPSHYYLRKEDGAWGFAQSGGIGGIVAAPDSLRQMMPEDKLWPALGTEAWSFHTVTQGADYFDAFRKALEASYGVPEDLQDFLRKAYAMNYSSSQGMFEAYARNKYDASGITTWKYDAAWPAAMTWQYVDWYKRPTAAYFGAKKACEALHIQYAYDDDGVYVLNTLNDGFNGLTATATLYDFSLVERYRESAPVAVGPDGKALAFKIAWQDGMSDTRFLSLELTDNQGEIQSRNFYWLSHTPDIPGRPRRLPGGIFGTEPESRADFMQLNTLPVVILERSLTMETSGDDRIVRVHLKNPSNNLAFMIRLALATNESSYEAAPVYWDDNYLSLLPGEERDIVARMPQDALLGDAPFLRVSGWNAQ